MIAIIIYILLVNTIYDSYAVALSTNWSIFNFAGVYIGYALLSLRTIRHTNSHYIYLCYSIAISYFIRAIVELSNINTPFNEYEISVNGIWVDLFYIIIIIGLIISLYAKEFKRVHI